MPIFPARLIGSTNTQVLENKLTYLNILSYDVFLEKKVIRFQAINLWADSRGEFMRLMRGKFLSKNLLIMILVIMFGGCSTYNDTAGLKFDTTAINRIEVGKTTQSEVIAMLGAPVSEKKLDNGIVIFYYAFGYQKSLGADNSVDSLQIQLFKGVVINKWQRISDFN
jgi:hypothetical protein